MKQILRFAVAKGYIESSPIADCRPSVFIRSHTVKNFARIEPAELPQLLTKIEIFQGTPLNRLAMKLIALTFVRTTPLIEAEWSEIDFPGKRLRGIQRFLRAEAVKSVGVSLRRALDTNAFRRTHQPLVSFQDGSLLGFEILLR